MKSRPAAILTPLKRVLASKLFRYGFVALTLAFGADYVTDQWGEIHRALARIGSLVSILSLVFVLGALVCAMLVWRVLLAGLGSPLSFRVAARVLFVGQLGKYLPGSVWPVFAQMELATEHDVPRHRTAAASVINMAVQLLAALVAGLVTLPFTGGVARYWWAFLIAAPLVACLYPPVLNAGLRSGLRLLRRPPLDQPLTGKVIAVAMGWSFASWLCYGLQIWVLMVRVGASPAAALPLATGGFAFAFAVGFVVVLAPAGVGFREVLLVAVLSPSIGAGPATAVTLVSRAATTLADVINAAAAVIFYRYAKSRGTLPATPAPAAGASTALTDPQRGTGGGESRHHPFGAVLARGTTPGPPIKGLEFTAPG